MADEEETPAEEAAPPAEEASPDQEAQPSEEPAPAPEEPPPKESPKEKIFLLEFIVDQINLDFCLSRQLKYIDGQICVSFSFLNNGPFDVCEGDFESKKTYSEKDSDRSGIKNGKSCLFSLTQAQIDEVKKSFEIDVKINKLAMVGGEQNKSFIGQTTMRVVRLFRELLELVEAGQAPLFAKTYKDCFSLMDYTGAEVVGHMSAYVRLSCFGKLIVNQFSMNTQDKSMDFKANQGHYLFKYNHPPPPPDNWPPCPPDPCTPQSSCCGPQPPCCAPQPSCCVPPPCCAPQPPCCAPQPPCCAPQPPCCAPQPPCCPSSGPPSCCCTNPPPLPKDIPKKPPCALGLMACNPPMCCHPKSTGPKPICSMPQPTCGSPTIPCLQRTTPCCVLRCDLGPKTCPCQQRSQNNQTEPKGKGKGKGKGKKKK